MIKLVRKASSHHVLADNRERKTETETNRHSHLAGRFNVWRARQDRKFRWHRGWRGWAAPRIYGALCSLDVNGFTPGARCDRSLSLGRVHGAVSSNEPS